MTWEENIKDLSANLEYFCKDCLAGLSEEQLVLLADALIQLTSLINEEKLVSLNEHQKDKIKKSRAEGNIAKEDIKKLKEISDITQSDHLAHLLCMYANFIAHLTPKANHYICRSC
jgi:hypothetical protein